MVTVKGKFYGEKLEREIEIDEKRVYGLKEIGKVLFIGILGAVDLKVEISDDKKRAEIIKDLKAPLKK